MNNKRSVIITGASSGIGAAIAKHLINKGFDVYLFARRIDRLNEITDNNTKAFGFQGDVTDEDQIKDFINKVKSKIKSVDILINCAGSFGSIGHITQTDSEEWLNTIKINLFGPYLFIKNTIPLMKASCSPRIINFAGGGAFNSFPNYSAYAVSKAGIVRLTENLAEELAPLGIKVNALAPGFVNTEIHNKTLEIGKELSGEQHYNLTIQKQKEGSIPINIPVECVDFLISDDAKELTGKTISASFDPWKNNEFANLIPDINNSELYTMKRINIVNLTDKKLVNDLNTLNNNN